MKEVIGHVFIGDRQDALNCLKNEEVKHILTIEREPLCSTGSESRDVRLKHVECLDEPEADLLSHLDECIEFIQEGLNKNKVLVHCSAGVSRSATVILAFIMKMQNIELNNAFENLKEVYPKANPNPGFMYQLQLFEAMGRKADKSNPLYKQFRLQIIAKELERTGCKQPTSETLANLTSNPTTSVIDLKEKKFRCRKCRYQLFKAGNCLQHVPGTGQEFLPWYSKSFVHEDQAINKNSCTSYFIEPVQWMMPLLLGRIEGKFFCPKCSGRIGSFNWAGEQCSCGRWVTPAFQLHKSRIDER